jgi:hypothetical protein
MHGMRGHLAAFANRLSAKSSNAISEFQPAEGNARRL